MNRAMSLNRVSLKMMLPIMLILQVWTSESRAQGADYWSDEFDGPAGTAPNPAKWNIAVTGNPANNEAQYYSNRLKNVALNGAGQLELIAYKEVMGSKQYTSGKVTSSGKFQQMYGRWEARIKLPAGVGFWPAFWMLGINNGCGGWPACGEIDIMENRGRSPRQSSSALHGPGYSGNTPIYHGYTLPTASATLMEDFHIFAADWTANQIRFYVDGVLHYTVNRPDVEKYGRWAYDRPFYAILNLAVGGQFDGNALPTDASLPARVTVDYVRIFREGTSAIKAWKPALRPAGAFVEATLGDALPGSARDALGRMPVGGPRRGQIFSGWISTIRSPGATSSPF